MPTLNKNQQNLEEEMKKHPVLTFADIIKALKEHPEWLEELRKIILTTELIELPRKIEKLFESVRKLEKRVGKIEEDVAVLKEDVAVLKQDVAVLKQDVAVLKKDVAYLKGEFGRFKGREFERTIREKYYAYFGRLLRKSKLVNFEEILPLLESAEDEGLITEEQKLSVFQLDLLVSGMLKSTKKEVLLAVEVSYSLHEQDVERSVERADILAYLLKKEVIPVLVAVEVRKEVEKKVEDKGALLIKTGF
ncbi:MAG TPA: hypothetical protein ENI03_01005 [Thermodesulfobacterium geofontis]|nr:hypothetical protein [Thermodesulfobacterium geofontis]